MEIVAGENACYTLLGFICLKMELHWRSNPIGKVRKNLPFLKELDDNKFTQKMTVPFFLIHNDHFGIVHAGKQVLVT